MKDPPRLISTGSGASRLERRMLAAWQDESPSRRARETTLAALGWCGHHRACACGARRPAQRLVLLQSGSASRVAATTSAASRLATAGWFFAGGFLRGSALERLFPTFRACK